jgi:hypothetical protein
MLTPGRENNVPHLTLPHPINIVMKLTLSVGNQILALVQCQMRGDLQPGPINTYLKWKELGRFVKRGERALTLCMPITCKRREENSDEEHTFISFVYKARCNRGFCEMEGSC